MEERRSAWYTLFAHALKSPQDVGTPNYSVIHIHCTLLHKLVCNIAIYCTSGCGIFLLVHMRVHQDLLLTSSSLESCAYRPMEACLLHLSHPSHPHTPSAESGDQYGLSQLFLPDNAQPSSNSGEECTSTSEDEKSKVKACSLLLVLYYTCTNSFY